jgi:enamine deaminase RidA (YjgF/YER057c/UK114 family)
MTIERMYTTERSSQITIHGETVYLAGRLPGEAPGGSIGQQTKDILQKIDQHLAKAGTDKSKRHCHGRPCLSGPL